MQNILFYFSVHRILKLIVCYGWLKGMLEFLRVLEVHQSKQGAMVLHSMNITVFMFVFSHFLGHGVGIKPRFLNKLAKFCASQIHPGVFNTKAYFFLYHIYNIAMICRHEKKETIFRGSWTHINTKTCLEVKQRKAPCTV